MSEEKRIYVVVPATVQIPSLNGDRKTARVLQPHGRQIAQACHVVSKLRMNYARTFGGQHAFYEPITTIILQARDSEELMHNWLAVGKKKLYAHIFSDENAAAYGTGVRPITAMAVLATPTQVRGILDYLPLWGS